ncbi:hypothetical protein [Streptomyces sp. NPDC048350]|uniref:hypothetical protein n=1 Tax=Streptomyces sp. NPDC048350 TaxID=3365538 RepID=UPI00371CC168
MSSSARHGAARVEDAREPERRLGASAARSAPQMALGGLLVAVAQACRLARQTSGRPLGRPSSPAGRIRRHPKRQRMAPSVRQGVPSPGRQSLA